MLGIIVLSAVFVLFGLVNAKSRDIVMQETSLQKSTDKLYTDTELKLLQFFNGEGYLSQGHDERVDFMVQNIELNNKAVLDFGCGLGGPAFHLAKKHNARVIGVDVDPSLIEKANNSTQARGFISSVNFTTIHDNLLSFADATFDIIFSKESIIHVQNKQALFKELYRVLKPGGMIVIMDWFWKGWSPSQDFLQCWNFDSYGTAMHFATITEYVSFLTQAGFIDVESDDSSYLYLNDMRQELDLLYGTKGDEIRVLFDAQFLEGCIATWSSLCRMFESGEIETRLILAKKKK